MLDLTDVVVAAFVALLVFGGLYVPRVADAIGRLFRGGGARRDESGKGPPRDRRTG
jgi:hypothetical protein